MEGATAAERRVKKSKGREDQAREMLKAFTRAFGAGAGLHLITALLGKRNFTRIVVQPARSGLFLGCLFGGYKTLRLVSRRQLGGWSALLSGIGAGTSLFIYEAESRTSTALYAAVRAAEFLFRASHQAGTWPRSLDMPNADVLIMCISASQILWGYRYALSTMPPPYQKFLAHHGGLDAWANEAVHNHSRNWPVDGVTLGPQLRSVNCTLADVLTATRDLDPCRVIHPNENCSGFISHFFPEAVARALKVYAPLHLILALVFKTSLFKSNPLAALKRVGVSTLWSSLFLGSYCSLGHASQCFLLGKLGVRNLIVQHLSVGVAGLSVLLEYKPRRLELALYCLPRAVQSLWNCLVIWGKVKPVRHGEVILFALSVGLMMHCYENHQASLRPGFYRAFRWLLRDPCRCMQPDCRHCNKSVEPEHKAVAASSE